MNVVVAMIVIAIITGMYISDVRMCIFSTAKLVELNYTIA